MNRKNTGFLRESFSFLLTILIAGAATISTASDHTPSFRRLDDPEPPHRSVFALLEDSDGFLWIGTQDGLARFDGYEMLTHRHDPDDPTTLSNSSIRMLLEDRRGRIWVGTENGLNTVDRRSRTITRMPTPNHPEGHGAWFNCSFEDRDGVLWFGTDDGLLRLDPADGTYRLLQHESGGSPGLASPAVVAIRQDPDGAIWVGTNGPEVHTLHRLSPDGLVEATYALDGVGTRVFSLLIDSGGRLWSHPGAPLDLEAAARGEFEPPATDVCFEVRASLEDKNGALWFACDDGLHRIDPTSGVSEHWPVVATGGTWLENFGRSLLEDRAGTLWVGTEGGLYRLDPHTKRFDHIGRNPMNPQSLSADAVSAIAEAPGGELWVATYGGGLNRVDPKTGTTHRFCTDPKDPRRCTSDVVWHLHTSPDGTLWVAGDELWSLDPTTERLTLHSTPGVIDEGVFYLAEDDSGSLWIGGVRGRLYRYASATGSLEVVGLELGPSNPENQNRLDSLLIEGDTLWIGFGENLGVFDTATGRLETIPLRSPTGERLGSLGTWAIHRGRDGRLWLGTAAGLLRHRTDDRFDLFTTRDGLPGSAVYSILEEVDGTMWLGTNQGLTRFRPDSPSDTRFRVFNAADGIGNTEFNRHAALHGSDGLMVFGGMEGLTLFRADEVEDNPFVPPVRITQIEVGGRTGVRPVSVAACDRLTLSPDDTTVSFEFSALSFTAPRLNRYAYRLDGFDASWVDAGTRRTTQYTNLPPGRYRFRVKGSNNDGVWNDIGTSLEVAVLPTLWETWWFRPILCLGIAGAGWALFRYRELKKREVERLRMRIAGDLHDDLSSDLSGIAVVADMVRQTDGVGAEEREDLGNIRDTSLRMADGLRDIVWYIDPDHDSLTATLRRMRQVASTLLRGIEHVFHADVPDRDRPLPVNVRRNVFLIFKEAVHNVVRHAGASTVGIGISLSGDKLQLEIVDDGCGFDLAAGGDGHGLRSMRRRAEEIGGRLEIDSSPGCGTTLRLVVGMAGSRDGRGPLIGRMVEGDRRD